MQVQVGHYVLEEQYVERTQYLKNFCPGPPHSFHWSLSFCTDFTVHKIVISTVHQLQLEKMSGYGTESSYLSCQLCQICAKSHFKIGQLKIDHSTPYQRIKTDGPPPLCSGQQYPPILFYQSLREHQESEVNCIVSPTV